MLIYLLVFIAFLMIGSFLEVYADTMFIGLSIIVSAILIRSAIKGQ